MRRFTKLLLCFVACFCVVSIFATPVFATNQDPNIVDTTFFGNLQDDGKGCGVYTIINLVINILTWGIGIAAILGIAISGILYLTAKGNQEQVVKSKRRIVEIVIGLAAYAVLYVALGFLLPGGNFNTSGQCATTDKSSSTYGKTNPWRTKVSDKNDGAKTKGSSSGGGSSSTSDTSVDGYRKKINDTALAYAWGLNQHSNSTKKPKSAFKTAWVQYKKQYDTGDSCHRNYGKSCGSFASTVLVAAGVDANTIKKKNYANNLQSYMSKSKKWKEISSPKAGTVGLKYNGSGQWHVKIFVEYNGKVRAAEASHCDFWGRISSGTGRTTHVYQYVGP